MNAVTFEERVKDYARFSHMVLITDHASARMIERDLTRRMIIRVLLNGSLEGSPKWNASRSSWEGKMKGAAAGSWLGVVCAIKDGLMTITVITAHKSAR